MYFLLFLCIFSYFAYASDCNSNGIYEGNWNTVLDYQKKVDGCPNMFECEPGFYCQNQERFNCPAGSFGSSWGLKTSECDGECPLGYYCPTFHDILMNTDRGTIDPLICGSADLFCPMGSIGPDYVPNGFYSIGSSAKTAFKVEKCEEGYFCKDGIRSMCPFGTFGNTKGLMTETCSGSCPKGYYCPLGTIIPLECGDEFYCPEGSRYPQRIWLNYDGIDGDYETELANQEKCKLGHYCIDGNIYKCPSGTFGDVDTLIDESCSGQCAPGYYCPEGSISSTQVECGGDNVFCPTGSSAPTSVKDGYFSLGGSSTTKFAEEICNKGHYCQNGVMKKCVPGHYGSSFGNTEPVCDGECEAGFYCRWGSSDAKQFSCGNVDSYCPQGSENPLYVVEGFYSVPVDVPVTQRADQSICELGHYCTGGIKTECPKGYYGGKEGLSSNQCSGQCDAGFFCELGSPSAQQYDCGDPSRFCPIGSFEPTDVTPGYYTITDATSNLITDRPSQRVSEVQCELGHYCTFGTKYPCPPGTFGDVPGLEQNQCSGFCDAGYYCPQASTSRQQNVCGSSDVFCPLGSAEPTPVSSGYYTSKGQGFDESINMLCEEDNAASTLNTSAGRLSPVTPVLSSMTKCSSGKLGAEDTRIEELPCEAGYFCVDGDRYQCPPGHYGSTTKLVDHTCSGYCDAGFLCDWASTSPQQQDCSLGADEFCPEGSAIARSVQVGWFTNEDVSITQRSSEESCLKGHYCVNGLRIICPAGNYGSTTGLSTSLCSGQCASGFYCPEGSISSEEVECGGSSVYCPLQSRVPTPVTPGYYTTGGNERNSTRTHQSLCEEGWWCDKGIKYPCGAGFYGEVTGLQSSLCSGKCDEGFFCPPNSISSTQYECADIFSGYVSLDGKKVPASLKFKGQFDSTFVWNDGEDRFGLEEVRMMVKAPGAVWQFATTTYPDHDDLRPDGVEQQLWFLKTGPSSVYCPLGSSLPTMVQSGYYTIGGDALNRTRVDESICPKGWYCMSGVRHPCSPTTYGNTEGLTDQNCSGYCPKAHYCPLASEEPIECGHHTFAPPAMDECIPCPGPILTGKQHCQDKRLCCNY